MKVRIGIPATADLEQLTGLRLDPLGGVQHHHRAVNCHEGAISILAEILVTGPVEEVDLAPGVVELERTVEVISEIPRSCSIAIQSDVA